MRHGVVLTLLLLVAPGCIEEQRAAPPAMGDAPVWRELSNGSYSGRHEPLRLVLENEAAWSVFWQEHTNITSEPPARPAVDFATERVVVVSAGDKGDSGWAIRVTGVDAGRSTIVAVTIYDGHMPDRAFATVITQPHDIVAIPRGGPVAFQEATVTGTPGG